MSTYDADLLDEEDEEMPATERELADDAQWKIIQKNTFTRWANEHLKTVDKSIHELEGDLGDGLRLLSLVEVLSGKKFKHINKRPNFRTQKLENVTMVLQFLEQDEGIRIVNIDSGDIVDSKLKLILGLIWTLILHYSISMPMWEGEEVQPQEGGPTPKQRLLNWIQSKVPDLPIKNLTSDFNDGRALGALVDAIAPGLCPDWEDWDPKKAKENAKEALDAAEKWLDVPQLIRPEEMTNPKVDDLSMMTYLSQFPHAKLKPGAPLRPRLNPNRVRAFGPGLEPKGNRMGQPAKFSVETFSAGKGELEIIVLDPKGKQAPCESVFTKDRNQTYACVYVPSMEGEYRVIIKFGSKEVHKSPFLVKVEGAAGDPSKVKASGPGIEKSGVVMKQKTYFEVFTKEAGKGEVTVTIMDASGHKDKIKPTIKPQPGKEGVYLVEYTAMEMGLHSVNVSFCNQPIPGSPFGVNVSAASNAKAVYATGRGIQPRGVRVKQHAEFRVHTKDAGKADVAVQIIGPGGMNLNCKVTPSKTEEGVCECLYIPLKIGQYVINITFGGQHITKSPFRVDVGPEKFSKIVAFGPGLEGGVVNQPACFTVETNGETGALGFSIEGPSQAKIDCKDNGDGSADVTYWPTTPGEYAIHILCNEEDIPQAPYMAQIQPATTAFDASKVTAKGPGLEPTGVVVGKWTEFIVDARKAGKSVLHITCLAGATYKPVNVEVKDNKDGTFSCKYNPKDPVKHTIIITWGTVGIPKSPFRVTVQEPTKPGNVKVYGPGVEKGVKTFVKTHFTVDCRSAGPGDVAIALTDERGKDVPVTTKDNKDGTFTVEYEAKTFGMYIVSVYFAEKEIPLSPIKVKVESSIDLTKVVVKGLETAIKLSEKRTIRVITSRVKTKDAPCTVTVMMPSGKTAELTTRKTPEGYGSDFVPTEVGKHKVNVTYMGQAVTESPFTVMVESTARLLVKGLEMPIQVDEARLVTIITSGLPKKDGPCKVTVTTPKKKTVELTVKKSPEGYTTTFTPTEPGTHKVEVVYDKKPAPDSPFTVEVEPKKMTPGVVVIGLETPIPLGETRPISIITSSMPKKDAPCKVTCTNPKGKTVELPVKKSPDGYTTSLKPTEVGPHKVTVTYDKKPVPNSPFPVEVEEPCVKVKGLETPIQVDEARLVTIITSGLPKKDGPCKVTVTTPKKKTVELPAKKSPEGYTTTFTPTEPGTHKVEVVYDKKPAPDSPFTVEVEPKKMTPGVVVIGLETPIPLGETRPISIITSSMPKKDAPCKVTCTNPKGKTVELPVKKSPDGYTTSLKPTEVGPHKVTVTYDKKPVPNSPFAVEVEEPCVKVKGLETPIQIGENRPITIDTSSMPKKDSPCKVTCTNPKGKTVELPITKSPEGYTTTLKPTEEGPHKVEVKYNNKPVPKSPFPIEVTTEKKETKPKPAVEVIGLDTPVQVGEKRPVKIITTNAPKKDAPCKVSTTNPKARTAEMKLKKIPEGYEGTFSPWDKGTHIVKVEYDSKELPESPFQVIVEKLDVTKVIVMGLDTPIELGSTRTIVITTKDTGRIDSLCKVYATSETKETIELTTKLMSEGYICDFTPTVKGKYTIKIEYGGKEVPKSPFEVTVETIDISGVKVKGLETPVMVTEKRPVLIDTTSTGRPDVPCKVSFMNPKSATAELPTKKNPTGHEAIFAPTEMGPHKVKVEVCGQEVPGSPFPVTVEKFEVKPVVKGLETPVTPGEKREVQIIAPTEKTSKFGPGPTCTVTTTTPKGKTTELKVTKGSVQFETEFSSRDVGDHKVKVEYSGKEVPGSPFTVVVQKKGAQLDKPDDVDVSKVQVTGLEKPVQVGENRPVTVDTTSTGNPDVPCKLTATNPKGETKDLPTKKVPEGYVATFAPLEEGPHVVKVDVAGKPVPKSPIHVKVEPKMELGKVEVKGLDTPIMVGEKRPVEVKTGKTDLPCKITATSPKGKPSDVPTSKTPDGYQATFAPLEVGPYKVKVEVGGQDVPKSPFSVDVEPKTDLNKVEVKGLETPVKLGEKRPVTITTDQTGNPTAPCKVTATSPKGKPTECPIEKTKAGYEATFAPLEEGPHVVKVEVAKKEIPKSPFKVAVEPKLDLTKVDVKGLEKPVEVDESRPVFIVTKGTGDEEAPCKVTATTPSGRTMFVPTKKSPDGYESTFKPKEVGPHTVKIEYGGVEVPKSPLPIEVEPKFDIKKLQVKGLEKPIPLGETRELEVVTTPTGKPNLPCKLSAKGPNKPYEELPLEKTPDGYKALYTPKESGPHDVHVIYAEKEVPNSPFYVSVEEQLAVVEEMVEELKQNRAESKPVTAATPVTVEGLESPIEVGEPRPVTINTTATGKPDAPCRVTVTNPRDQTAELPTQRTPEGYSTVFAPVEPGPHKVHVNFAGQEVPRSPFPVNVERKPDVGAVTIRGLETPIEVGEPRPITIDTSATGRPDAPCWVAVTNPRGQTAELPTQMTPRGYQTVFAPLEPGPHQVNVNFAGKEVPRSPFPVNVEPRPDVGAVFVKGLETPIEVGEPRPITVDTIATGRPDAPCWVAITNPRGQTAELATQMTPRGYQTVFAPLEPGPHQVNVNFAGKEVPRSPFPVNVEPRPDVGAVFVKGLESPIEVGESRPIMVDTSATGRPDAPCWVAITNPRGQTAELPAQMTPQGYQTIFAPLEPGLHQVDVNFAGKEVPRSPFPVNVEPRPDVGAVFVKGLESPIEVGEPRPITVDTSATGRPDASCWVAVTNPRGQTAELPTQMTPHGYQTVFAPLEPGPHQVNVNFAGKEVPRSPFPVNVEPRPDVGAVFVKGLETSIEVGEPRPITVDTSATGRHDAPCWVAVTNPRGQTAELPTQMTPRGYQTVFAPLEPGPHQVNVNFAGKEVPRSPFPVNVEPRPDVGAVFVIGLESPIEVGEPRPIMVDTSATGRPDAPCWVAVTNPRGQTAELPAQMTPQGYQTVFAPREPGPHQVDVNFAGYDVPRSPFAVYVEPRPNAGMVEVFGLDYPIQVDEARPIMVNTAATGKPDAPCRVTTSNQQGQVTELVTKKTPEGYQAIFAPLASGPHKVNVNFAGQEIPKSPFTVDVEPRADVTKVDVLGLDTPIKVAEPRPVTIMTSTTGKPDAPCSVQVINPSGQTAELPTRKIPEGYIATFAPLEEGPHKVKVLFDGIEVPKSPFNVMAEPAIDFNKVKVSGLEKPVEVGEIRPVTIETAECGVVDAPCQVTATNPVGQVRELPVQKTPKGYEAEFAPLEDGPHKVAVKYAGKELPKSPFSVEAKPQGPAAAKVKVYGPGLEKGTAKEPCNFTIDTREVTQPGGLGVTVEGPAESKIECRDNQDGTCDVTYHPTVPGDYSINVTYAEEHVTHSPFHATIKPSTDIDVSKVKAYGPGLEPGVFLDSPTGFTVDAKSVTPNGEGKVRAIVTSPTGQRIESLVKNMEDGTYDVLYTPYEQGPNTIDVTYEDIPIPQSPIQVNAAPGCDASRVRAYGPGLEGGITEEKQTFTVDVKGAGQGGLALAIDGPAETQINCKDNRDGTCEVEYMPVKRGDYDITIKFADQHIPGSPFNVGVKNPVNPAKVECYGPGVDSKEIEAGQPVTFTVDTTEAGEAPLEVTYTDQTGQEKPAEVVPVSEGKFNATYYAVEEGKCRVDVKYDNQHVPRSPFNMRVEPGVDANKVKVNGDGIQPKVLASMPCSFTIDCREAGEAPLDVVIQRPDGTHIRPSITNNHDGTYLVQYTPEDTGPYRIDITYGGQPVNGTPFKVEALPTGDATRCTITKGFEHQVLVERETVVSIDASNAGTGKVTCRIRSQDGTEIDIDICENENGTFSIMFTPSYPGDYKICIKFGGEVIPGGDYIVQAVNYQEYEEYLQKKAGEDFISPDTVDAVHSAPPGKGLFNPIDIKFTVGPIFSFVTGTITMPSGKKAYPTIEDNKDGTITVRYQPTETGRHELCISYEQTPIKGSPFQFHVDAVNSGFVTAYGPGLSHGVAHEPTEFTIVTKDAGAGGLALAIEGPSKTEIKCKDNGDGTCTVSYVPTAIGEYNITCKFADQHISGSPFTAKVTPGEQRQRAQLGRSSEVSLKVTETDIGNLTASIRSPSGHEEPCMLKRLPNGHLGISFTPREVGEHLVNVFRDGKHIADSPFKIYVGESELGNASKVRVSGKGLEEGVSNEVNEFIVDTRDAGYGGLSLSIEGPSKADIECHDNEDGTCRVTYKPTEPGTYIINIKFADEHVPGSSFNVKITGEPSERITERIMRHREAADVTHVGSQCELSLKIPASYLLRMMGYSVSQTKQGTSPFDMTASVTNPSGVTELCDVVSLDDSHYSIKFVPQEMGVHTVSVKHKDMHIPGSPFEFTVGPIAGGGAHKVHAAGPGLGRGEVTHPCEFNVYTHEAGAGGLSIAIEGASKAEVDFEDRKDGSCGVNYTVTEPGEYIVSIKFNDEHIPDSPFRVPITPSIGDARKISVTALQNKGLQVGKPCAFMVNFNGAPKGKLHARVVTPSGSEEEALIQEIDDGEYAIRFIPRENGPHLVFVRFDGCEIPDSPFLIQVGTVLADAGKVTAYGEGLRTGKTGSQCKFIVNTCNAGAGALAVTVEGPSKVKLECREVDDGYEFTYNPTAPGDYLISIRYAGTNIAASPFKAKIEGTGKSSGFHEQASVVVETVTKTSVTSKFASLQSSDYDASKVICEGNGLKKGYRNKSCSFTVDTTQAGRSMLFIGMIGPKGPCEELNVKHHPGNPYKITYIVKERGDYMLAVKWGEDHIPGSPFIVKVD